MSQQKDSRYYTEEGVIEDIQRQPILSLQLAENSLAVAEKLRDNYFKNTAKFVKDLRKSTGAYAQNVRKKPILIPYQVENADWKNVQNEVVTFIDGGIGQIEISNQISVLLRVGSYTVHIGERDLTKREQFEQYSMVFGDLEGGSKESKDFTHIVRIIAELLGGLYALESIPNLDVLMFHGPLIYTVWHYMGHTPFTENDIDLLLNKFVPNANLEVDIKEQFLEEAKSYMYPNMTKYADEWIQKRLFEPLSWMAFLYRQLIFKARKRSRLPIIVGVVERGTLKEFNRNVLLARIFIGLKNNGKENYFNKLYDRTDLTSADKLLNHLKYDDVSLLAMLLETGEYSEPWDMSKEYSGLRKGKLTLPGESSIDYVDYSFLKRKEFGFPQIQGCYLQVSQNTKPIRVEVFKELGDNQIIEATRRVYLYSRLLPGYGFPVGLDIVDKYAKVPNWLTEAYGKLIRHHLGVSLQSGEISDADMRRILVQSIYMTHRDWLFRPKN